MLGARPAHISANERVLSETVHIALSYPHTARVGDESMRKGCFSIRTRSGSVSMELRQLREAATAESLAKCTNYRARRRLAPFRSV